VRPPAAILLLVAVEAMAAAATPEQERDSLIRVLKQRFPGTTSADWIAGVSSNLSGVAAIPMSPEHSTNFADVLAIGKKAWDRPFADGKSLANCFANGGRNVAATYPQVDAKEHRVITLQVAINNCRRLHGEQEIGLAANATWGPLIAYVRSLSLGQKLSVRVPGAVALEVFESGKALFRRRIGDHAYACASCHVQHAGESYAEGGAIRVLPPPVGPAVTWPRVEPGSTVRTLQMQFQRCMLRAGAVPWELGTKEMDELEFYFAQLSSGLPIQALSTTK